MLNIFLVDTTMILFYVKYKTVINIMITCSYGKLRVIIYYYGETREEEMFYFNMPRATQRWNEPTLESKHSLE